MTGRDLRRLRQEISKVNEQLCCEYDGMEG